MTDETAQKYAARFTRYTRALRNEKPDRVPIRPFVAEFVGRHAGYTCQELTQDFNQAFAATLKTCQDFDWDAAVANMVYVWGGLAQTVGLKYYQIPGVGLDQNTGFQYLEPPEHEPFMRADEYDALIADPTGFLFNVWFPRVAGSVAKPGEPNTYRNNVAFLQSGMAMMRYFGAFPAQIDRMKTEAGTVSAIAGILKAPLDILADKLRGYLGLAEDLIERRDKVQAACAALMPHLLHTAYTSSDPTGVLPIGFWMHRTCVPMISQRDFDEIHWPTLKPIVQELWQRGRQVLFYAEGKWGPHLKTFAELPEKSIVFHCDRDDLEEVSRTLSKKFAISGGIPNYLLAYGTPAEVRAACKKAIDTVRPRGAYIMDASAIIQNDATVENMHALTDFTREYGRY